MNSQEENIRISEIFGPTIQGEGALIGRPTVFVRTGGCDYRCSWCDTLFAVESQYRHEWKAMSSEKIWQQIQRLSDGNPLMVSLSGGNPAIQPLGPLIQHGKSQGYTFALETQGSVAKNWFRNLDVLTFSPKPPSSGMCTDWALFEECLAAAHDKPKIILKFVVFDEADYLYAREATRRYEYFSVYLQPGNHTPPSLDSAALNEVDIQGITDRMRWLVNRVVEDRWFSATVLPQLHVMLWGNARGV